MNKQDFSDKKQIAELKRQLQRRLDQSECLCLGNVLRQYYHRRPGHVLGPYYQWTRKVKGKTVTVALSKEQYEAFERAIKANREIEELLDGIRALSRKLLLEIIPGVARRPRRNGRKSPLS